MGSEITMITCFECGYEMAYIDNDYKEGVKVTGCDKCKNKKVEANVIAESGNKEKSQLDIIKDGKPVTFFWERNDLNNAMMYWVSLTNSMYAGKINDVNKIKKNIRLKYEQKTI